MSGIGILARDIVDLAKRAHRLKHSVLVCLLAAWPLVASTEPGPARPAERPAVSQTAPLDATDPLAVWFKEQDKLLDDILARLARIELLVREIHRLISQIPDRLQVPAAAPPPAQPSPPPPAQPSPPPAAATPVPSPVVVPPAVPAGAKKPRRAPPPEEEEPPPAGIDTFLAEHGALLGGVVIALLLLFWLSRRRAAPAAGRRESAAPGKPAAAKPAPVSVAAPAPVSPPESEPEAATISVPPSSLDVGSGQADQALELAEIMLSMGLGHGAAQTLTEQIRSEPKQALRHWLKLLEIYRANGQQAEFERSAEELRLHFNVKPEDWKARPGVQQGIENYPHIASRIASLWPTAECLAYLENLLADNRGGARSGFPQAVAEEFLLLEGMLRYELIP